ncbi:MAG TPA: hypothetical protein DEA08_14880 [Planctomycetes bacterium]|nr:hypothetical protein [Planctomycetota bacterium]
MSGKRRGFWTDLQEAFVEKAQGFVAQVFKQPRKRQAAPPLPPRSMPCELYLTMGWNSLKLFPQGPIDDFRFFQRGGVSLSHEVEFLARLDEKDLGSENYAPYGMFKLSGDSGERLPSLETDAELWATLNEVYGLPSLPSIHALASHGFQAFDPRYGDLTSGENSIEPPQSAKAYVRGNWRHYSYADVLEILRAEMTTPQRIAWMEVAFQDPPPAGEIVHRYYLDRRKTAWLVRHHWSDGKRIYEAQTNAEALDFCIASGHFSRMVTRPKALAA